MLENINTASESQHSYRKHFRLPRSTMNTVHHISLCEEIISLKI